MFDTAFTLSVTQFARSMSFPERIQHRTARNAALESWRIRNAGLDALFYDVKVLTAEEIFYLSDAIAAEGLIMIVPPAGGAMLTICDSVEEYMLRGGREVHALAIAGIGGSALGAAAFARNVADALGEPVAAVVSGFGLGDIVNEAIGGAFFFGWLGNFRNDCEMIDEVVGRPRLGASSDRPETTANPQPGCLDVDTVKALIGDTRLDFHLLAGHSKGNMVLAEALYELRGTNPARLAKLGREASIVTFGARIAMPPDFAAVTDVMGALDWYGEMNSRPMLETDIKVPMAGHSTNTDLVGSLPVTATLKTIMARPVPAPDAAAGPEPIGHSETPLSLPARVVSLEIANQPVAEVAEPPVIEVEEPPVVIEQTPPEAVEAAKSEDIEQEPSEAVEVQETAKNEAPADVHSEPRPLAFSPVPDLMADTALATMAEVAEAGNKTEAPDPLGTAPTAKAPPRRPPSTGGRAKPGRK